MSDRTHNNNDLLKNEHTRIRRAWVDRAVAIVRQRLERDTEAPAREPPRQQGHLTVIRGGREG
jgi:hypothetical protein